MTSDIPAADQSEETYDLYTRLGTGFAIVLKHTNQGVWLGSDHIGWTNAGRREAASFADIAAIHLRTGTQSIEGPMGATLCQMCFKNGDALTVFSGDASGAHDSTQAERYRAFIGSLHRRLGPKERAHVPDVPGMLLQTGRAESLYITVDGHPAPSLGAGMFSRVEAVLDPQALIAGKAVRN